MHAHMAVPTVCTRTHGVGGTNMNINGQQMNQSF